MGESTPTLARQYNQQGCILHAQNKFKEAIELYKKAENEDPSLLEAYINQGSAYAMMKEYDKAKEVYHKALALDEQNGMIYFFLGNIEFLAKDDHAGKQYYAKALKYGYDDAALYLNLAQVDTSENDLDNAIRNLDKAAEKDTYSIEPKLRKVQIYLGQKKFAEALQAVEEIIDNNPDTWLGQHYKTLIFIEQNKLLEAEQTLNEALNVFPDVKELILDKMILLEKQEKFTEAIQVIDHELTDLKSYALSLEKAKMQLAKNKIEESTLLLEDIINGSDDITIINEARHFLTNIYIATTNFEKALALSEKTISSNQKNIYYYSALYYKPFCLDKLGRKSESEKEYKSSINILMQESSAHPEKLELYIYVATCFKDLKIYNRAFEIVNFLLEVNPEIAEAYLLRSEIYKDMNKPEKAEADRKTAAAKSKFIQSLTLGQNS